MNSIRWKETFFEWVKSLKERRKRLVFVRFGAIAAGIVLLWAVLCLLRPSAVTGVANPVRLPRTMSLYVGDTVTLPVKNAAEGITYTVSSDKAQVDETGMVTALEEGKVEVTAEAYGQSSTCRITMTYRPEDKLKKLSYGDFQEETSPAAQTLLSIVQHYNDVMEADDDPWYNGNWNKNVPKKQTFQEMLKAEVKGANCSYPLNWALRDMKLLKPEDSNLYGNTVGKLHGYDTPKDRSLRKMVNRYFTVTRLEEGTTLTQLIEEGRVQPGDILFMKLHTFIYRGEGTVFASANDGKVNKDGEYPVYISWVNEVENSYDRKIPLNYLLRFKEDFVPKYCCDKDGNMVKSPLYTAIHKNGYRYTPKKLNK